jgi:hypothetical protein
VSDKDALIKEKSELIKQMLEMQKKFIGIEHDGGIDPKDYYSPAPGSELEGYVKQYNELARKVNKLAHEIKESGHIH